MTTRKMVWVIGNGIGNDNDSAGEIILVAMVNPADVQRLHDGCCQGFRRFVMLQRSMFRQEEESQRLLSWLAS